MTSDDLAARLLATFIGELEDQVRTMNADLLALERDPTDAEHLKSLFRVAHTLKGAARAAGVPLVEQACHALETLLARARDREVTLDEPAFALLFAAADALADAGQRLRSREDLVNAPVAAMRDALKSAFGAAAQAGPADAAVARLAMPSPAVAATRAAPPLGRGGDATVRIAGDKLDALLATTGQLLIASSRVTDRPAELQALHDLVGRAASEWNRAGRRLRLSLGRAGAPPALLQATIDLDDTLRRVLRETSRLTATAADDARSLAQVTDAVVDRVRQLRVRRFAEACESLPRVVRDLAATLQKDVEIDIEGSDVQVDRAVIDGLREALVHLVRNAVDHGIESPGDRAQAGKPRVGRVRVGAAIRGDRLIVTVVDDGAGLNVPAIRSQLASRGLTAPPEDQALARALFEGGVSTRGEVTAISGRGVGLDLVRAAVERIRGSVTVSWLAGRGTTFSLECPPSLATIRALVFAMGSQLLAFPTSHVERLVRVRAHEIKRVEGGDVIPDAAGPVPLVPLARLLPPLEQRTGDGVVLAVVLRAANRSLAVAVDELVAEQEVVLRPVETGGGALPLISGAAILGRGRVVLILDPSAVVGAGLAFGAGPPLAEAEANAAGVSKSRLLVVEDSITTRALERSVLEAAGYEVLTAVDGADGWKVLQERGADLVVSDVEMPRMDGFALCEAMRASKRFRTVPIVLVTALESPEQRARGLEVGADAYLGKSSFDQQSMLDTIGQLLGLP